MTEQGSYQGWTNRPTWAVALWLDNDEPLYRRMQAFARGGLVTPELTRTWVEGLSGDAAANLRREGAPLDEVNWQEIMDDCVLASIEEG